MKDDPRIGMELRALLPRTNNLKAIANPVGSPCAELMVDKPEVCVFLRSTANRAYDYKNVVRTPDFKDRLSAASAAKKAQIERARAIADDPARLRRIEARSEIIAARNIRIAERERIRREAIAREAAERAAAEAAEAAALEAARKAEEEAQEARLLEQARLEAAAAAKMEALLAIRRAGRKKKKRKGH